jgi:hypothetical protein
MAQAKPPQVRDIEDRPTVELTVSTAHVCQMVLLARAFDEKVPPVEDDPGSNPGDDGELIILEDFADDPTLQELTASIESLNDDAKDELVAMMWLGRGDYGVDSWNQALSDARAMRDKHVAGYLVTTPMLGDLLEEGLNQLGHSCSRHATEVFVEKAPPIRPEEGPDRP